jgi:hypothetical protein
MTKNDYKWLFLIIVIIALTAISTKCCAQPKQTAVIDTVVCNINCIQKFVEVPSSTTGKTKTYAVYVNKQHNINELIPVSQSIIEYINLCKQNNIEPTLGIRLRNGQISSIIRYRQKFIVYYEKR